MTDLVVWEGDASKLPEISSPFFYKDREYFWIECPCGCEKPLGFHMDNLDKRDFEMTVRLRGTDQSDSLATFLVKIGKTDELIQTKGDENAIIKLFDKTLEELGKPSKENNALLASKGITQEEMFLAIARSVGIPSELALLLTIP